MTMNKECSILRKNMILMVLLLFAASMLAQQLSEQEAKQKALAFLTKGRRANQQLHIAKGNLEKLFAFNVDGGGYVIVSGDRRTLPILGYSDEGVIDFNNMPDNMQAWLKGYEFAIEALGDADDLGEQDKPAANRPAVEPMLKTKWNQLYPYNKLCPVFDGTLNPDWEGKSGATGCVVTAMSMLMKYHEWPTEECKPIPSYSFSYTFDNNTLDTMTLEALPAVRFDWANMLDIYSENKFASTDTEEQQKAVAELMQYCGQAVHMRYTPIGSGAPSVFVAKALMGYFDYDRDLRFVSRAFYGIDGWEDMIYNEIAEGRPVYYAGFTEEEGHAFVCDGYDGEGHFHINWGWSGNNDGYFLLSVLNPNDNTNIGSSNSNLGYSMGQEAVIGIKPAASGTPEIIDEPYFYLGKDLEYDNEEQTLSVWVNHWWLKSDTINVDISLCSIDNEGNLKEHYVSQPQMIDAIEWNEFVIPIDDISLEEGIGTKLYPCVRSMESGVEQWQRLTPDFQYFEATRVDGVTLIRINPELNLGISSIRHDNETNGRWYTLKGMRIAHPNSSGIYIKDKKAIIIK